MSRGYTLRLHEANLNADPNHVGVRLGRLCIARDTPVVVVAKELGVSRATVYHWFTGAVMPHNPDRVEAYITRLS